MSFLTNLLSSMPWSFLFPTPPLLHCAVTTSPCGVYVGYSRVHLRHVLHGLGPVDNAASPLLGQTLFGLPLILVWDWHLLLGEQHYGCHHPCT
jgi:hypothetical protein